MKHVNVDGGAWKSSVFCSVFLLCLAPVDAAVASLPFLLHSMEVNYTMESIARAERVHKRRKIQAALSSLATGVISNASTVVLRTLHVSLWEVSTFGRSFVCFAVLAGNHGLLKTRTRPTYTTRSETVRQGGEPLNVMAQEARANVYSNFLIIFVMSCFDN